MASLGRAAEALQGRIAQLVALAVGSGHGSGGARLALSRISLEAMCGRYHDYRAGAPRPKLDLVAALRAAMASANGELSAQIHHLITDVERGIYDEDRVEARRWVAEISPAITPGPDPSTTASSAPRTIPALTEDELRVFLWLYRYCEVYGRSPSLREVARGLDRRSLWVSARMRQLASKRAVAKIGGSRGWVPTRAP